jgi:hypothetical protein
MEEIQRLRDEADELGLKLALPALEETLLAGILHQGSEKRS